MLSRIAKTAVGAIIGQPDGTHRTTHIREQNTVSTLETIADANTSARDRITIDTADGDQLVISATRDGRVSVRQSPPRP